MRLTKPETWREAFLPKWKRLQWTRQKWFMLFFAACVFVDSFFVPFSQGVDPGGAGDGMLFLILVFRTASPGELPFHVVVIGGFLTAVTLALNHHLLRSPSLLWTSVAILLLIVLILWRPRSTGETSSRR